MICEWKIFSRLFFFFGRKKDEGKKIKEKKKTSKKAQQRCHGIIVHYASNWAVMNYQRNNCTIDHNGLIVSTSLPFTYFFNQWKLSTKMSLWVSILISPLWLGVGWGLGSPCRLQGSSPDLSVAGLVGRHWKGIGGAQTTKLLGLEGASLCLAGPCGRVSSGKLWCCPGPGMDWPPTIYDTGSFSLTHACLSAPSRLSCLQIYPQARHFTPKRKPTTQVAWPLNHSLTITGAHTWFYCGSSHSGFDYYSSMASWGEKQ